MPLRLSPTQTAFNAQGDGSFNTPLAEQLAFFRQKLNLPTAHYDDILKAAHDRAFVVAGAMKADLLTDFNTAITKTMREGKSIQWFRQEFNAIVQQHGWEGWTGSDSKAGRDWRTRIIYQTNLSTSYAAGRYQQLMDPDLLKTRPYWKYIHSDTVQHPRPLHVSWSGTVLRYDDPWWITHAPPNGWGCQCRVKAVRPSEYQGEPAPDDGTYTKTDRYGVTHTLPKGVDYGWDYQPGASNSALLRQVIAKQDKADWRLARANTLALVESPYFVRWHDRIVGAVKALVTDHPGIGKDMLIKLARTKLSRGEQFPIAVLDERSQNLVGAAARTVTLSDDDLIKQAVSREGQDFTANDYLAAHDTIEQAQRIVRDRDEYTLFIHRGTAIYVAVLQKTKSGKAVFLKSFRRGNERDAEAQLRKAQRQGGQVLKDEW